MNYFKQNNKIFAYDGEQVAKGYGKDMTVLDSGEFYDGTSIKPYNDGYVAVVRDADGNVTAPVELVTQLQEEAEANLQATYTTAMEDMMDTQAKSRGYDNRYTASIRAGNPNSPFYTEALAFSTWMDNCYSMGYKILADVKAGTRTMPTVDAFLLELPKLVW